MQSTFTFKQLTIVGFRQTKFRHRKITPKSSNVRLPSLDSGGTVPDSCQTGGNLAGAAESSTIWPGSWMDLAESLASLAGMLPEQQDPGQDSRLPVNWSGFSRFVNPAQMARCRIPVTFVGIRMRQILKYIY
jgi:hypothetical protein